MHQTAKYSNTEKMSFNNFPIDDAAGALSMLRRSQQQAQQQNQESENVSTPPSFEGEAETTCPILDALFSINNDSKILHMTNFSRYEFLNIYFVVEEDIKEIFCIGKGKRIKVAPLNVFFMLLSLLKNGSTWELSASQFRIPCNTFQRNMWFLLHTIESTLYRHAIHNLENNNPMHELASKNCLFRHYEFARYTTDVRFQQTSRPLGTHDDIKSYYSGKHHMHGYKTEVSVLPTGLCIFSSLYERGSVADILIFRKHREWRVRALTKKAQEQNIENSGVLQSAFPTQWCVLVDKGYQGLSDQICAVHPKRKPKGGRLSLSEKRTNDKISSDRVIVENFFDRETALWKIMSNQYCWNEQGYDTVVKVCRSFTNLHIRLFPLRAAEKETYVSYRKRLYQFGIIADEQRKRKRRAFQNSRRERLQFERDIIQTSAITANHNSQSPEPVQVHQNETDVLVLNGDDSIVNHHENCVL